MGLAQGNIPFLLASNFPPISGYNPSRASPMRQPRSKPSNRSRTRPIFLLTTRPSQINILFTTKLLLRMNVSKPYDKSCQRTSIHSVPTRIRQSPLSIGHEHDATNRPRCVPRHPGSGSLYEYDARRPEIGKSAPRLDKSN